MKPVKLLSSQMSSDPSTPTFIVNPQLATPLNISPPKQKRTKKEVVLSDDSDFEL